MTIGALNEVLAIELMAINQYFVHAKACEHWGYERLAERFRNDSIEEMKDAEQLMDRVLQLGGLPNLQRLDPFQIGEVPKEQLELALELEEQAITTLLSAIEVTEQEGDPATNTFLRRLLLSEQEQVEWLETQLSLIEQLGEQLYLAQQVRS
jgi:bacterioferritin